MRALGGYLISLKDKDIVLKKINENINFLSKTNKNYGPSFFWFQQSPLHWFLILYVVKFYIEQKNISKNEVLELINKNVMIESKKTTTTEFKYINDALAKGYIIGKKSNTDLRKTTLIPSSETLIDIINYFQNYKKIS